jgi:hypothetical protein
VRYLVVGTLPPPRLPRTGSLLAEVDRLEGLGHSVSVAPVVGAGGLGGIPELNVWRILRRRRHGRRVADRLVLQIEPDLAGTLDGGRRRRALSLVLLATGLAGWDDVELRLESFDDMPGGVGGRAAQLVWRLATRVVVPTASQRSALHEQAGVPLASISVSERAVGDSAAPWPAGAGVTREAVMDVVRRRAAADRVLAGWHPTPAVTRMLAEAGGPPPSPFGPLEPLVRYVYERPALREPVRRVRGVLRRRS